MKKLMKKSLFFSFSILMGVTLFFSSCSRQQGVVSFNNEKLQKQSFEIENSKNTYSNDEKQSVSAPAINKEENSSSNLSSAATTSTAIASGKVAAKDSKMSLGQKMVLKKLTKKLSPEENQDVKRSSGIDQKLKLAIIFAIIGIIAGLFSWWAGTILILIALIFLLLWAVENL